MQAGLASKIILGNKETGRQWKFAILSATALLLFAFLVSYIKPADWWESAGLPITVGSIFLTGLFGGARRYGFVYALAPAYSFMVLIVQWAFVLRAGPGQATRIVLGTMLLPLLITLPIVVGGYLTGMAVHLLRSR